MQELTGNEARVLVAIAYFDGPGGAWPGLATIAETAGLKHRSAVSTSLEGLRRKGRIKWRRRHGANHETNLYTIAYGEPFSFDNSQCPENPVIGEIPNVREIRLPMSGKSDTNLKEHRTFCKNGDGCGWMLDPGRDRCMVCGQEAEWPF